MSTIKDLALVIRDISCIAADILKIQTNHITSAYKKVMTELLSWLLFVLVAILLAIGGLIFIFYGIHVYFARRLGEVGSSILLGGIILLFSMIIFLLGNKKIK